MLLLASNASRSGQGTLEGVPSISSMDAERFGMASRPLQRYAFAGERVQLEVRGSLHCGISTRLTSAQGQNEKPPFSGLCPLLPPPPDIRLPMLPPPCAGSGPEQVQQ